MFYRSQRLLLRPGWVEDATELTARIADEAIVRNLARAPWPYREEHALGWLSATASSRFPSLLLILPSETGAPIVGGCGLHEGPAGDAEIGYWIARERWGQGFATEAACALLTLARAMGYSRVMGRHAIDNPASGKVLRKAGFIPTGRVGNMFSLGRGAEVAAPEYVAELGECAGGDDPSEMPQAA